MDWWLYALIAAGIVVSFLLRRSEGDDDVHRLAAKGALSRLSTALARNPQAVHARDAGGATPLHLGAEAKSTTVLDLLAANGAVIDARDAEGVTPLMRAVAVGNSAAARWLIAHGADPDECDDLGRTALH